MILKDLLSSLSSLSPNLSHLSEDQRNLEVASIEIDSRKVKKGSVFFALKGRSVNALQFIDDALSKGAILVVCDVDAKIDIGKYGAKLLKSSDIHHSLVLALGKLYHDLPNNLLAVTGTNGKTSVAEFTRQILQLTGRKAASIGTLGVICDDQAIYKHLQQSALTTPDIVSLYQSLALLKQYGVNDVVIEASSIGLEQGRMDGLSFDIAAFTNFTLDHLDYHGSMANYLKSKSLLFSNLLKSDGVAVLNADIEQYQPLSKLCNRVFSYGKNGADVKLIEALPIKDGQQVCFEVTGQKYKAELSICAQFQAMNLLCALSMLMALHIDIKEHLTELIPQFKTLKPASGRMEKVAVLNNAAQIYIDFAHTPDALENVLNNARSFTKGRLVVLFGCGGDRDKEKRPIMGKIACDLADLVIVSDDNPRCEDAAQIRKEILAACDKGKEVIEIAGRKDAITQAISMLKANDVLVIAGKGHEQYQIIGTEKLPFNESAIVKAALK
ncbi:MAG: UDP-N-acetylmuramoyl-L-alanyl-D-glutamate--2,6-diaminopimelate ligase [Proteobacteria bacterium]|nr:UDP-N-acetylmuramoyl-L-alanyl-D-glutamate--2,6-diaminopimelate ligase [Pseudomonadota bacterium]